MAAPVSPRRTLGDLVLPWRVVRALAWGMIAVPFALPSVAWEFGWVRPPETATPPALVESTVKKKEVKPAPVMPAIPISLDPPFRGDPPLRGDGTGEPLADPAGGPSITTQSPWKTKGGFFATIHSGGSWQNATLATIGDGSLVLKVKGFYDVRCKVKIDDTGSPAELMDCKDRGTEKAETADIKSTSISLKCNLTPDYEKCTGSYSSKRGSDRYSISLIRRLKTVQK